MRSARDRTVTARTTKYLEVSQRLKVGIEELESLLVQMSRAIFKTLSSDGPGEFFVVCV